MPVESGHGDPSKDMAGRTRVAEISDDAWLILDNTYPTDELVLEEVVDDPARFRLIFWDNLSEEYQWNDMVFESFRDAALAAGLWEKCGPFNHPEGHAIPVEVATHSKAAIAAYLRIGDGVVRSRDYVAHKMDVSKRTVSNYCSEIRWTPEKAKQERSD